MSYNICACSCLSSRMFSRRIRSMALRQAAVVSQPPGLGGTPSAGPRDSGPERLGRRLLGNVEIAETPRQGRDHPRPLLAVPRVSASWTSITRTCRGRGKAATRACDCRPWTPRRRAERHIGIGSLDDPHARDVLLRLQEGTVGEQRHLTPAVDDGGRAGVREAIGEYPMALRLEPVVERADGSHVARGTRVAQVVEHGYQGTAFRIISCGLGHPGGQPLTLTTNTSAPIRQRLPDFFQDFWRASLPTRRQRGRLPAESRTAERSTILRGLVGSTVHGLNVTAGIEDRDEMGVCVEPLEAAMSLREPFAQFIYRSAAEREGRQDPRTSAGDLDPTIYSSASGFGWHSRAIRRSSCCCSHRTINSSRATRLERSCARWRQSSCRVGPSSHTSAIAG